MQLWVKYSVNINYLSRSLCKHNLFVIDCHLVTWRNWNNIVSALIIYVMKWHTVSLNTFTKYNAQRIISLTFPQVILIIVISVCCFDFSLYNKLYTIENRLLVYGMDTFHRTAFLFVVISIISFQQFIIKIITFIMSY